MHTILLPTRFRFNSSEFTLQGLCDHLCRKHPHLPARRRRHVLHPRLHRRRATRRRRRRRQERARPRLPHLPRGGVEAPGGALLGRHLLHHARGEPLAVHQRTTPPLNCVFPAPGNRQRLLPRRGLHHGDRRQLVGGVAPAQGQVHGGCLLHHVPLGDSDGH